MYQSASEVIRAGLRLLKAEKEPKPRFVVSSTDELEEKLLVGIRQLDRGEGIPGEVAARKLREVSFCRSTGGAHYR
jgi:Arc/MetJ-type ribon-helix-helix transcriptional regulator